MPIGAQLLPENRYNKKHDYLSHMNIHDNKSNFGRISYFGILNPILTFKLTFDIWPQFECQNRILNVKNQYSAPVRMSKSDFECQNAIFGRMSK